MDVAVSVVEFLPFEVLLLEGDTPLVGARYDEEIEAQAHDRDEESREKIGIHQTPETHSSREHGYDLAVAGQFGGEENHRDEDKQRAEHIDEVRNEIQVIIEDNSFQRGLLVDEVIYLLTDIENDDYDDNQQQRHEESTYELPYDVAVQ